MATREDIAHAVVQAFLEGNAASGRVVWTYGDMAIAIGRAGQHRLLGDPLDHVRTICKSRGWPDIATVVVSKESLLAGTVEPSRTALEKYGGWPQLRLQQAEVFGFRWADVAL